MAPQWPLSHGGNEFSAVLGFLPYSSVLLEFGGNFPNTTCWSIKAALSCSKVPLDDAQCGGGYITPLTQTQVTSQDISRMHWKWNRERQKLLDQSICLGMQEPRERAPCIVGWGEVEAPKVVCDEASREFYYCTYCNHRLSSRRSFVISWKDVIFCESCKNIPQCKACNKKAVPFAYTDPDGLPCISKSADFEGLCICGQCMLIRPVGSDKLMIHGIEERARTFLEAFFGVAFNEELLSAQYEPEFDSIFRILSGSKDTDVVQELRGKQQPSERNTKPKPFSSFPPLPFTVESTGCHLMGRSRNIFGQCQTMTVTIPSRGTVTEYPVTRQTKCRLVLRILVARGLPESLFLAHLVHELLHAFIYLSTEGGCKRGIERSCEEGMCNTVMAACLHARCQVLQRRRKEIIDRLEGIGLRPMTKPRPEELDSLPRVKQLLRSARTLNEPKHGSAEAWIVAESMLIPIPRCIPSLYHQLGLTEYELKVLNKKLSAMEYDDHEEYGKGYRRMRSLAERLPLSKILRNLRNGKEHTRRDSS